jgi:hypothetical protein
MSSLPETESLWCMPQVYFVFTGNGKSLWRMAQSPAHRPVVFTEAKSHWSMTSGHGPITSAQVYVVFTGNGKSLWRMAQSPAHMTYIYVVFVFIVIYD